MLVEKKISLNQEDLGKLQERIGRLTQIAFELGVREGSE